MEYFFLFRQNPSFDTERTLQELGVGEALVSVLDPKGIPTVVERAGILPPRSSMNAVEDDVLARVTKGSSLYSKYQKVLDRESAYELLTQQQEEEEKERAKEEKEKAKLAAKKEKEKAKKSTSRKKSTLQKTVDSTVSSIGREFGRQLVRGLFGTLLR